MGFRDYSPGLNRFLSRDMYTGALADLNLGMSPWTNNRYAFTGGNPTTFIEIDGHFFDDIGDWIEDQANEVVTGAQNYAVGVKDRAVDTWDDLGVVGSCMMLNKDGGFNQLGESAQATWNDPSLLIEPYTSRISEGDYSGALGYGTVDMLGVLFGTRGLTNATSTTTKVVDDGADAATNAAHGTNLAADLAVAEMANPLIASLRTTGSLSANYVTRAQATAAGWAAPGKALGNYIPGGQLGGDVFKDAGSIGLPTAPGRTWFEADIGLSNAISRAKQPGSRLLYSNDGLAYVTPDNYGRLYQLPGW